MKYQRGDIVLVDFPFSDRTGSKTRPALVVQDDRWNQALDDTILAVISTSRRRMKAAAATQLFVPLTPQSPTTTGLRADSVVQCEILLTLDQRLILSSIGRLDDQSLEQVDDCLRAALSLSRHP